MAEEAGNGKESWQKNGPFWTWEATPINARQDADKFWVWLARVVGYTRRFHSCVRLHDVGGSCVSRDVKIPLQLQTCSHLAGGFS